MKDTEMLVNEILNLKVNNPDNIKKNIESVLSKYEINKKSNLKEMDTIYNGGD